MFCALRSFRPDLGAAIGRSPAVLVEYQSDPGWGTSDATLTLKSVLRIVKCSRE